MEGGYIDCCHSPWQTLSLSQLSKTLDCDGRGHACRNLDSSDTNERYCEPIDCYSLDKNSTLIYWIYPIKFTWPSSLFLPLEALPVENFVNANYKWYGALMIHVSMFQCLNLTSVLLISLLLPFEVCIYWIIERKHFLHGWRKPLKTDLHSSLYYFLIFSYPVLFYGYSLHE